MFDDDLMQAAAQAARRYPIGMVPGEHPAEILAGLHRGFTRGQLAVLSADEGLRDLIRRVLDEIGVTPELATIAARPDLRGAAHRSLLASLGHPSSGGPDLDELERAIWAILAQAPQVAATKAEPGTETLRWVVPDQHTAADVVVTRQDCDYYLAVVPEAGSGASVLLVQWEGQPEVEAHPVTLALHESLHVQLHAFGRTLLRVALATREAER